MSQSSILLLSDTQGLWAATGDAVRADGYWGSASTTHTIAAHLQAFNGRLYLEASLAEDPQDDDWFPIFLGDSTPYAEYRAKTGVEAFTVQANVAYLRARIDRDYLADAPKDPSIIATYGVVKQVLLNN